MPAAHEQPLHRRWLEDTRRGEGGGERGHQEKLRVWTTKAICQAVAQPHTCVVARRRVASSSCRCKSSLCRTLDVCDAAPTLATLCPDSEGRRGHAVAAAKSPSNGTRGPGWTALPTVSQQWVQAELWSQQDEHDGMRRLLKMRARQDGLWEPQQNSTTMQGPVCHARPSPFHNEEVAALNPNRNHNANCERLDPPSFAVLDIRCTSGAGRSSTLPSVCRALRVCGLRREGLPSGDEPPDIRR